MTTNNSLLLKLNSKNRVTALAALNSPAPDLDFVLPGLLAGTAGLIVAPGGTGKSWFAMSIACAVAAGIPVADGVFAAPKNTGRVLIIAGEDPDTILSERWKALMTHYKNNGIAVDKLQKIDDNVDIISGHGTLDLLMEVSGNSTSIGKLSTELIELKDRNYRLIVIDPLSRLHDADENNNGHMTRLMKIIEHIGKETGATMLALHHASKSSVADSKISARGASALTDACRWLLTLNGEGDSIKATLAKANYISYQEPQALDRLSTGVLTKQQKKGNRREQATFKS